MFVICLTAASVERLGCSMNLDGFSWSIRVYIGYLLIRRRTCIYWILPYTIRCPIFISLQTEYLAGWSSIDPLHSRLLLTSTQLCFPCSTGDVSSSFHVSVQLNTDVTWQNIFFLHNVRVVSFSVRFSSSKVRVIHSETAHYVNYMHSHVHAAQTKPFARACWCMARGRFQSSF